VAGILEKRNSYNILVGRSAKKRQFGIPGHCWEDNFRMILNKVGEDGLD